MKNFALAALMFSILLSLTVPSSATQAKHPDCSAPVYHQFDFWAGDFVVHDRSGVLQGTNIVTHEYDGCVLQEHWKSADDPQIGTSLSFYDIRTKQYIHFWVDSWGNTVELHGHMQGKSMVMQGERLTPDGNLAIERTRWTALNDRQLNQFWDYSLDAGKTWKTRLDWIYTRK
ncbi:MAG: hypothetical protein M3Z14_00725 [Candidatus Eremiobacteraeota bacterium]|nr:hypothetical protein [Candidatus Eremiobacteraeota bacterium]